MREATGGELPDDGGGRKPDHREGLRFLRAVVSDLFTVSFCVYALLAFAETIDKGWVSNFFNLDILLAVVLASGIVTLLFSPAISERPAVQPGGTASRTWAWCLGIICGILTWRFTRDLGAFSLFISLGSGAAVVLLSTLPGNDEAESISPD